MKIMQDIQLELWLCALALAQGLLKRSCSNGGRCTWCMTDMPCYTFQSRIVVESAILLAAASGCLQCKGKKMPLYVVHKRCCTVLW